VRIAHETLDGEVVILDQESGTYFSLAGAGADIWGQFAASATVDEVNAFCEATFEDADAAGMRASVRGLCDELLAERLIEAVGSPSGLLPEAVGSPSGLLPEAVDAAPALTNAASAAATAGTKRAWVAPQLERFTDLQTLLLLDPIHDVDESGWPRTAP